MHKFFPYGYIFLWATLAVCSFIVLVVKHSRYEICRFEYLRFLLRPWKIMTFLMAFGGIVFIAPYTGDPTWDYYNAGFMSLLTFVTSPWSVGIIYRYFKGLGSGDALVISSCLWMFSASWSYDIYLFWRDGYYPYTWDVNILASSILYFSAGLFWSLERRVDRGVIFAFMEKQWFPEGVESSFSPLLLYITPFVIFVSCLILSFLVR